MHSPIKYDSSHKEANKCKPQTPLTVSKRKISIDEDLLSPTKQMQVMQFLENESLESEIFSYPEIKGIGGDARIQQNPVVYSWDLPAFLGIKSLKSASSGLIERLVLQVKQIATLEKNLTDC